MQLPESLRESVQFSHDDLLLSGYTTVSTIEVTTPHLPQGPRYVFHALGTNSEPFGSLDVRRVSVNGDPESDTLETIPLQGASLRLRVVEPSSGREIMSID